MGELLTVDEVARECRIHPITVRRHIAAGRLRAVRIGRRVRIRREDLEAFAEEAGPGAERPREKTGIIGPDDPLIRSIGCISDDSATDVSENKYKYLAEAYYPSEN